MNAQMTECQDLHTEHRFCSQKVYLQYGGMLLQRRQRRQCTPCI